MSVHPDIDKLAWLTFDSRRLLMTRSHGKTALYLPGGKREVGETDEAALVREIREEVAVDLERSSIRYVETFRGQADAKPEGVMVVVKCFEASYRGSLRASAEIAELVWVTSADRDQCSLVAKMILDHVVAAGQVD